MGDSEIGTLTTRLERLEMLLWIDLETTGLNPEQDIPLEVGLILMYEEGLVEIARKSWLCAVKDYDFYPSDPFVNQMHSKNGLLDELEQAEPYPFWTTIDNELCTWLDETLFFDVKQDLHPAGSSVHFDVDFCRKRFPAFTNNLHHRYLDVSSIKMLFPLVGGTYQSGPEDKHRALSDLDNDLTWLRGFLDGAGLVEQLWNNLGSAS